MPKVRDADDKSALGAPPPVPLSATVWLADAFPALSEMVRVALRAPVDAGVKVTTILQAPPAATLPLQLLVAAKSPALVPPTAMLAMVSAAEPLLLRTTVWELLVVPTA